MSLDDDYAELIGKLLELGALEITGFDSKTQQITYNLTPKCEEILPELFEEHFKFVNELAFKLWNDGLVEMAFDKDGTPMVMLTQEAVDKKDMLPDDERFFIENLIEKDRKRKDGII